MDRFRGERLSRRADRLAGAGKRNEVPDEDYFRDVSQKPEYAPLRDESEAPREKVVRVAKSFNYAGSGLIDPKNDYRVVLAGTSDDGAPVERTVAIPHGMLDLRDSDLADPTSKNDKILEAIRRVDAGEIPSSEPAVNPQPKDTPPVDDHVLSAPVYFPDIGPLHSAAATEKKTMKPHRFIPLWMLPFLAPFAAAAGMAWLQYKTIKGMWWASGKAYGEKGGGGHEKKEKKHEKKDDHGHGGGGGHGHH